MNGVFIEKAYTVQNRFFLAAVDQWNRTFYCLGKYSKWCMACTRHSAIVSFVPAIFIMITGKIHAYGILCESFIYMGPDTVQAKSGAISFGNHFHHIESIPGIGGIKASFMQPGLIAFSQHEHIFHLSQFFYTPHPEFFRHIGSYIAPVAIYI